METLYFKLKNQERDEAGYRQRLQKHADCFLACAKFLDTTITLMHKNNPGDGKYQYAVVALLVRQLAEALDAMSVLVAQGIVDPCKSHLRTALEAALYVMYMLEADTENRALAYHVASVHKQLALYKKIDPTNPKYKAREQNVLALYPVAEVKAEIAALEDDLKLPVYAPIEAEWQKVKKAIKRKPAWHHLFGGPQDVSKLAEHLGGSFRYDFLYGPWSDYLHAGAVMMNIFKSRTVEGKNAMKPLRHPDGLLQWRSVGPFLAIEVVDHVKDKYLGEPTKVVLERECMKNVMPAFDEMMCSGINVQWR